MKYKDNLISGTCQFTLDHYSECIDLALEQGYKIGPVKDWSFLRDEEKYILLRHDIDFNPSYAVEMAYAEITRKVKSTYYVLLHSEFYNALSPDSMRDIRTISDLGHEIGYHVNSQHILKDEYKLLELITGKPVRTFSHHFPTQTPRPKIDGDHQLLNARDPMIDVKYISDSCRNWREGCFCQNINKYDKMEILTHPIWYVHETSTRDDAINKTHYDLRKEVDNNIECLKAQIPDYLKEIGGK